MGKCLFFCPTWAHELFEIIQIWTEDKARCDRGLETWIVDTLWYF